MPPHLKTNPTGSPVRGRHGQPQARHHSTPPTASVTLSASSRNHLSPSRHGLPPRADNGHPPRPPTQKMQFMRSPRYQQKLKLQQQQQQQQQLDDHCSMSSMSAANSGATPSSVYMPSVALSRDVSDLSGLSGGTRASSVPGQIFDPKTFQQPWRQAYCLSPQPPSVAVTQNDRNDAAKKRKDCGDNGESGNSNKFQGTSIWVAQNDVVEIFDSLQTALGLDRFQMTTAVQQHNRIPILILLMDPQRHCYELMQIWVDRALDSVRDLMQSLQKNLAQDQPQHHLRHLQSNQTIQQKPTQWKQAYDGIFQVRGHRFTQLINIIRLVKYDVQPYEILVAKPWAMTAKVTIAFAGTIIRHLKSIGVISPNGSATGGPNGSKPSGAIEDSPLLLSKKAQERTYIPEGILDHHHAVQFVSFVPPFEKNVNINHLSSTRSQDDGLSSLGSISEDHQDVMNIIASLQHDANPPSPRSVIEINIDDNASTRKYNTTGQSRDKFDPTVRTLFREAGSECSIPAAKPGVRGLFSKLNCCRQNNAEKPKISSLDDAASLSNLTPNTKAAVKLHQFRETSLTALSEEEELQWLAYSISPIAEDQSLTGGSVISMSAPLLKASKSDMKGGGAPSQSSESAGGFPQLRPYTGSDMYEV
ncbi:hypothetical protein IV203_001140 [Nitzschia inconspicua]|uniref:Uncharacterized protein n=1 Tax=Nitzschia inconspicua TaxID=303405 RepID=A0A9K3L763_9STRA|nr:hypothetical protein IV203_001140 [Nitzschia inconspicua]